MREPLSRGRSQQRGRCRARFVPAVWRSGQCIPLVSRGSPCLIGRVRRRVSNHRHAMSSAQTWTTLCERVEAVGRPSATLVLSVSVPGRTTARVFVPREQSVPGEFIRDHLDAGELAAAREAIFGLRGSKIAKEASANRWRGLRRTQLDRKSICEMCLSLGRQSRATVVDHRQPHRGSEQLYL